MSEATKFSPSPSADARSGVALFAATRRSGSLSESTTIAYEPSSVLTRPARGLGEADALLHVLVDQVRDDLGVGLRRQRAAARARAPRAARGSSR